LLEDVVARLMRVIQPVKFAHPGSRFGIVAKLLRLAIRIVALLDELVPLLKIFERTLHVLRISAATRSRSGASLDEFSDLSESSLRHLAIVGRHIDAKYGHGISICLLRFL